VVVSVWVLDVAHVIVLGVVLAGNIAIVDSDVAVAGRQPWQLYLCMS
jgi:hypothetical protein